MRVFIAAPDIWQGDAVGNHCFGLMRMTRRIGLEASLYAQRFSNGVFPIEKLFEEITEHDLLILSYSIYDPILERFLALRCRKWCYFHGVTPARLLQDFEPITADLCSRSVDQFKDLRHFDIVIANSEFTAGSLLSHMRVDQIQIIPPVCIDMPFFCSKKSFTTLFSSEKQKKLLLVGRVVPHKCVEDAIDILSNVRAAGIDAQLTIIGSTPNKTYHDHLKKKAYSNDIASFVVMTGTLNDEQLYAHFSSADLFLSVSRHEGFCVPVLEAMHLGIPTLVRSGTAASELGSDSVFHFSNISEASESTISLLTNPNHAAALSKAGQRRSAEILERANDDVWRNLFAINKH